MTKIRIPKYGNGTFDSLRDAYQRLKKDPYGWRSYVFEDLVQYNICYRDILRVLGLNALKEFMFNEVPKLRNEQEIFKDLEETCLKGKFLAEYDIQCYDIHEPITIMGHTFCDLADIQSHVEIDATPSMNLLIYTRDDVIPYPDIHIGELYDGYPKFDSSDDCDDRTYQNYFFRKLTLTNEDVHETFQINHGSNFCMAHEHIPQELLPILYYEGDGDYMLLASAKTKTIGNGSHSVFGRTIKKLNL